MIQKLGTTFGPRRRERGKPDPKTAPLQRASLEADTKTAVLYTPFPLFLRESFLSRMKLPPLTVVRGQRCINLTQTGLKSEGFIPKPAYPEAVIPRLAVCISEPLHKPPHPEAEDHRVSSMHIGEELHKPSPMEASSRPARP